MNAITFALAAFDVLPGLIAAGMDVVSFISKTSADLKAMQAEGRDPTPEEWDTLNKVVEDLRASRPDLTKEGE